MQLRNLKIKLKCCVGLLHEVSDVVLFLQIPEKIAFLYVETEKNKDFSAFTTEKCRF